MHGKLGKYRHVEQTWHKQSLSKLQAMQWRLYSYSSSGGCDSSIGWNKQNLQIRYTYSYSRLGMYGEDYRQVEEAKQTKYMHGGGFQNKQLAIASNPLTNYFATSYII